MTTTLNPSPPPPSICHWPPCPSLSLSSTLPKSSSLSPFSTYFKIPSQISSLSLSLYSSPLQALHPFQDLQLPSPFALPLRPPPLAARRCSIVWFRADLRLHDHEAPSSANGDSLSLLPVFLFDSGTSAGPVPDSIAPAPAAPASSLTPSLTSAPGCAAADLISLRAAGAEAVFAHWEVSQDEAPVAERVIKAMEAEGV
ncbi:FAD binding domain of DNA photolyase [Musa troglodytarum]|uniref:FAD binding domain of DNA photolyase n=1 Tax=Musa troglodytarum TaxID=320322 RepID=A0A9E7EIQ3_9LILI|nr:FAD binding domain of DNA photolyase [Musa troglodytarum]